TVSTWTDEAADAAMRGDPSRTRSRLSRLSTRSRRPHDRREDRRPGAADLHPSADVSRGDPDAEAWRGDSGQGQASGSGLQVALDELPGHRHGESLRLDYRTHPRGPILLDWHCGHLL